MISSSEREGELSVQQAEASPEVLPHAATIWECQEELHHNRWMSRWSSFTRYKNIIWLLLSQTYLHIWFFVHLIHFSCVRVLTLISDRRAAQHVDEEDVARTQDPVHRDDEKLCGHDMVSDRASFYSASQIKLIARSLSSLSYLYFLQLIYLFWDTFLISTVSHPSPAYTASHAPPVPDKSTDSYSILTVFSYNS